MAYGDDNSFTAWAVAFGYTLPSDETARSVLRQKGSAYINGVYGADFSGVPTDGFAQEDAWPRVGACAYGQAVPSDLIPVAIINASYAAGWYEANNPGGLSVAASSAGALKRKKIDVIEKEYFEGSGDVVADNTVRIGAVEGLLAPFLRQPEIAIFVV